ncbi:MAG: hypothetical protein MJ007_05360 [Paludibacteraceae bacterium]|nr:hypothetical protein [Paludibacteraceae bacterium]
MEQEELFREINSTIANIEAEMVKLKELVQEFRSEGVKEFRSEITESPNHRINVQAEHRQTCLYVEAKPLITSKASNPQITETPHIDGRLIADLHKAIGLNDRIRFQRELFNGDAGLMNATVDFLNAVSSYSEALKYLNENFSWKDDDETVVYFKEILKRKAYK